MAYPEDTKQPATIVNSRYVAALLQALEEIPPVDLIVLSGDLTSRASPYEFDQHEAFCNALQAVWSTSPPVFCVPGNHDVSWDISKISTSVLPPTCPSKEANAGYSRLRFSPYQDILPVHTETRHAEPRRPGDFIQLQQHAGIFLVGLNTAYEDDHDTNPHHGAVSPGQLKLLETAFRDAPPDTLRIVVAHHHLAMMPVPEEWRDYSAAQNAESLLERFEDWRVDLVLHGHRHYPTLKAEVRGSWRSHLFGAGSALTIPRERADGAIPPCVHIVEALGRDTETETVFGTRRSLSAGIGGQTVAWYSVTITDPMSSNLSLAPERFGPALPESALRTLIGEILDESPREVGSKLAARSDAYGATDSTLLKCLTEEAGARGLELVNLSNPLEEWKAV